MAIQVDVTVRSAATTASVTTESTKATADIAITGPQGPPGTGLTDSTTHWSSDRDFMPYASGEQSLGSGNYPWGEVFANTGFFNELTVSGGLNVSGDFNIGDSLTDKITTQGDLYVKDDAFFADEVVITGNTQAANISPRTHDTYDLGSITARWANLYAKSGHFADNTITLGVDGARISVVSNKIQLQGNSATEGPYFIGDTHVDAGTLSAQRAFGVQFQILNTNATNSYKFSLDDSGNLGISGNVGSDKTGVVNFSNNVSIATSGYFRLPVGTTAERPPEVFDGMVRLNTTNSQFEGYHSSNWQGLGGVIDVDRDTYVSTEKTSDDDTLYFYTNGTERAKIQKNGQAKFHYKTYIGNNLVVSGDLEVKGDDTTVDHLKVKKDLRVLDNSYFSDNITVTGLAYFKDDVDIEENLTVSGSVTASDPTQNGHLSTKSYVDSADSNLQTQITSNDTDVTALQVATGSLQTQVTSNDTDVSTLNTATGVLLSQITSNDTDISNINTNVNALLGDAVRTTGSQTITGIKTFNDSAVFLSDVRVSGNIDLGDSAFDKITSKGIYM